MSCEASHLGTSSPAYQSSMDYGGHNYLDEQMKIRSLRIFVPMGLTGKLRHFKLEYITITSLNHAVSSKINCQSSQTFWGDLPPLDNLVVGA